MREMGEEQRRPRVSYVIGPDGSPLTLADLPPPNTNRWVIRRKAEVVAAVRGGLLSLDDACKRYDRRILEMAMPDRPAWAARSQDDEGPKLQTAWPHALTNGPH